MVLPLTYRIPISTTLFLNRQVSCCRVWRSPNFGQSQPHYYKQPSPEEQRSAQEFRDTVLALRQAKTDEEKADVRAKLNDLVSKQIDQDLAEREKRLNELEAKAKQLRDQLQQRKQTRPRFRRCW